ncbi:imidazole glycerol phosphate synthase subunit HisH [Verrucomicrobia bacterium]|nr:imidazole glycerol phosphate synthase subunit HisH [Verrucomicrobiota bacterium]MDA7657484.1 imidazole glycerol phosphate synthase subunit HisH [Verrucomicrobiota bacterium]
MITIVDYGMGNLGSIKNMLDRVDTLSTISSDPDVIARAEKLILPGVGAFEHALARIEERNLREVLNRKGLKEKIPILGICLGMQLLVAGSDEGGLPGLGWIPGWATRFPSNTNLKVPHMGWNAVETNHTSPLTEDLPDEPRFYFVHSYFVSVSDQQHSMFKTNYGVQFDSGIHRDNIFGVQFHPEKSHRFGKKLLTNFAAL